MAALQRVHVQQKVKGKDQHATMLELSTKQFIAYKTDSDHNVGNSGKNSRSKT